MPQGLQADLAFDNLPKPLPEGIGHGRHLTRWNPADWPLAADWAPEVGHFLAGKTGQQLGAFIEQRLAQGAVIYPPQPFRALALTPLADVEVVILGQDPYHGPGQAQGLAFSVPDGVKPPPSLRNIFKELARDPAVAPEAHSGGSLERWASQGVLLLNTSLTVEEGQAASHARQGWEELTDQLIAAVAAKPEPVVFMLWGAHAQTKQALIPARHLVLTANHPSPLSALRPPKPFIGCGHFSAANDFLRSHGRRPVRW
ncbi:MULTISPECIES: uracil-DNA glycosylase [unclassified Polaromonas]|jgi:uracil-DNA glycosylase|uniref:uracil-DNA glycosylase n=1 Tax=unclassified Polaromonas TaxID=2638319 RepID=UPI000BC6368E|nr:MULTISPECIES: uracil-DNA glycosylase [unclassified Polaromonas]OYY32255.1 MAG: uracil-DNA glycosylase [Polaromonas sp. 35-63-35]OYZ20774.1 MAG: uracil-DNA glycosylase [Polaromonas sp. 16-63-31]OYZ78367.1 MAG: uracil-DNA glycosylase [Polaromonas sp. 24-63-21]OZA49199.1 MAG: uracil-DNA glycosylase [Polaromonas sp. 17-63-33]OZA85952.1 MAG: uracil-DNA glycosylase [Polaromonas sp. 39-63-25]